MVLYSDLGAQTFSKYSDQGQPIFSKYSDQIFSKYSAIKANTGREQQIFSKYRAAARQHMKLRLTIRSRPPPLEHMNPRLTTRSWRRRPWRGKRNWSGKRIREEEERSNLRAAGVGIYWGGGDLGEGTEGGGGHRKKLQPRRRRRDEGRRLGAGKRRGNFLDRAGSPAPVRDTVMRSRIRARKDAHADGRNANLISQTVGDLIFLFCQIF